MAANSNIFKMSNAGGFKSLNRYYDMLAGNTVWNPWEPAGAYESIAAITVPSGGVASVTFSSTPQTYSHLQIRSLLRGTNASSAIETFIRYNGTSTNYLGGHQFYGQGTSVTADSDNRTDSNYLMYSTAASATSNLFTVCVTDILDYTNTDKNKVINKDDF
jgi:hypothetical protein